MATATPVSTPISSLPKSERRFCQLLAVSGEPIAVGELSKLYRSIDWPGLPTKSMTVADVKRLTGSLIDRGVLLKESYNSVSTPAHLRAAAVQNAIHEETFDLISERIQVAFPR